jgi:hypothetical protein
MMGLASLTLASAVADARPSYDLLVRHHVAARDGDRDLAAPSGGHDLDVGTAYVAIEHGASRHRGIGNARSDQGWIRKRAVDETDRRQRQAKADTALVVVPRDLPAMTPVRGETMTGMAMDVPAVHKGPHAAPMEADVTSAGTAGTRAAGAAWSRRRLERGRQRAEGKCRDDAGNENMTRHHALPMLSSRIARETSAAGGGGWHT